MPSEPPCTRTACRPRRPTAATRLVHAAAAVPDGGDDGRDGGGDDPRDLKPEDE